MLGKIFKPKVFLISLLAMVCVSFSYAPIVFAEEDMQEWNQSYEVEQKVFFTGNKKLGTTLDNSAASSQAGGLVRIPSTGSGYLVGSYVTLSGTTNYDGTHEVQAAAANTFDITATYVAETFDGDETVKSVISPSSGRYKFKSFEIHLSAASATSENLTVTKDATEGSAYDVLLYSIDMNGYRDIVYSFDPPISCEDGDKIIFEWSNSNSRTYGITCTLRR